MTGNRIVRIGYEELPEVLSPIDGFGVSNEMKAVFADVLNVFFDEHGDNSMTKVMLYLSRSFTLAANSSIKIFRDVDVFRIINAWIQEVPGATIASISPLLPAISKSLVNEIISRGLDS